MFHTHLPIWYRESGLKFSILIPAGTRAVPAVGFPRPAYWALPWPQIRKEEKEYLEARGFLLLEAEVSPELPNLEVQTP